MGNKEYEPTEPSYPTRLGLLRTVFEEEPRTVSCIGEIPTETGITFYSYFELDNLARNKELLPALNHQFMEGFKAFHYSGEFVPKGVRTPFYQFDDSPIDPRDQPNHPEDKEAETTITVLLFPNEKIAKMACFAAAKEGNGNTRNGRKDLQSSVPDEAFLIPYSLISGSGGESNLLTQLYSLSKNQLDKMRYAIYVSNLPTAMKLAVTEANRKRPDQEFLQQIYEDYATTALKYARLCVPKKRREEGKSRFSEEYTRCIGIISGYSLEELRDAFDTIHRKTATKSEILSSRLVELSRESQIIRLGSLLEMAENQSIPPAKDLKFALRHGDLSMINHGYSNAAIEHVKANFDSEFTRERIGDESDAAKEYEFILGIIEGHSVEDIKSAVKAVISN